MIVAYFSTHSRIEFFGPYYKVKHGIIDPTLNWYAAKLVQISAQANICDVHE